MRDNKVWQNKLLQDSGEDRDMMKTILHMLNNSKVNNIHSNDLGRKIGLGRIFETLFTGHEKTR